MDKSMFGNWRFTVHSSLLYTHFHLPTSSNFLPCNLLITFPEIDLISIHSFRLWHHEICHDRAGNITREEDPEHICNAEFVL